MICAGLLTRSRCKFLCPYTHSASAPCSQSKKALIKLQYPSRASIFWSPGRCMWKCTVTEPKRRFLYRKDFWGQAVHWKMVYWKCALKMEACGESKLGLVACLIWPFIFCLHAVTKCLHVTLSGLKSYHLCNSKHSVLALALMLQHILQTLIAKHFTQHSSNYCLCYKISCFLEKHNYDVLCKPRNLWQKCWKVYKSQMLCRSKRLGSETT